MSPPASGTVAATRSASAGPSGRTATPSSVASSASASRATSSSAARRYAPSSATVGSATSAPSAATSMRARSASATAADGSSSESRYSAMSSGSSTVTRFAMRLSYMCSSWAPWKTRVVTTDLAAPVRSTAAPKPRGSRAPLVALLLGTAGVVYRVVLTALEVPPTNSDEGTMGLAALPVLHAGEHPAFFYGQHYMGTLEAYPALPLVALTGPTVVALRLPAIVLYAAFLWLMYRLTTR